MHIIADHISKNIKRIAPIVSFYYTVFCSSLCVIRSFLLQGYPQKIRLQRRLYGIYTVCSLIFTIPCNCKLVCFFVKSSNKPSVPSFVGNPACLLDIDIYIFFACLTVCLYPINVKTAKPIESKFGRFLDDRIFKNLSL